MWELFTIIGTIAFAISGAVVAVEEEYDLLGVYVLGMVTAFGGGAIRNVLLGLPINLLWSQKYLFIIALAVMTLLFYFPSKMGPYWKKWGTLIDAIGLSAFSIQGALLAKDANLPVSAIIVSAVLTGAGGGIVRDLLAKRQPLVLKYELYALWSILSGLVVFMDNTHLRITIYLLFIAIIILRMVSYKYDWKLPKLKKNNSKEG